VATYYVAEGGTAANKAAATSGTYPGGCMSPAVHNGETFSAGDSVLFSDEGGVIRATITPPTSGTSGVGEEITYGVKSGDSPEISGADVITGSTPEIGAIFPSDATNGDNVTTADNSALDITGDIDIRVDIVLDDYSPASDQPIVSKWGGGDERSYFVFINNAGNLFLLTTPDGTYPNRVECVATAAVSTVVGDGERIQIRATQDVDTGGGNNDTKFYYKFSGDLSSSSGWTQLGSTVTKSGTTSIHAGTDTLFIGVNGSNTAQIMSGNVFRVMLYDGIGGTVEYDARFEDEDAETTSFTESSSNGLTVTINQNGGDSDITIGDTGAGVFVWAASGSGTNEFYLTSPSISEPPQVFLDGTRMSGGTVGSLADHEWVWDDNDTLGYDTVYIRDNTGTPNSSEVVIEASQRNNCLAETAKSYLTIDGIVFEKASQDNVKLSGAGSNIVAQNCEFNNAYWRGIQKDDVGTLSAVTVNSCVVSYNGGSGIHAAIGADGWTISENDVHNNCVLNARSAYTAGIKVNISPNHIIEKNLSYSNGLGEWSSSTNCGIWCDGNGCDDIIVRYNRCYDNDFIGIRLEAGATDCVAMCNVVFENYHSGIALKANADAGAEVSGNFIYNNTSVGNAYYGAIIEGSDGDADSCINNEIKNNILVNNGQRNLATRFGGENDGTEGSGNVYEYNCLGAEANDFVEWGLSNPLDTYDAWETAYGGTTHSVEADPSFTNAAADDYTLASDSPCIGAGANLGASYDDALMPSSTWPDGVVTGDQDDY